MFPRISAHSKFPEVPPVTLPTDPTEDLDFHGTFLSSADHELERIRSNEAKKQLEKDVGALQLIIHLEDNAKLTLVQVDDEFEDPIM